MRPMTRLPFALILCAAIAGCSDETPPATAQTEVGSKTSAVAQADIHDPRTPSSSAASRTPVRHGPIELDNSDRPGDMPKVRPTGRIECDQFAEKMRQCVNSGALSAESREALRSEYVIAMNEAKFKGGDLSKTCLDLQEKLQPRLVQAGCRNF